METPGHGEKSRQYKRMTFIKKGKQRDKKTLLSAKKVSIWLSWLHLDVNSALCHLLKIYVNNNSANNNKNKLGTCHCPGDKSFSISDACAAECGHVQAAHQRTACGK